MNQYAISGASFPMHISAQEFAACSLTDKDYTEIDGYIQSKILEVARVGLSALSVTERAELLQASIKAAASSGWGTQEGMKIINTVEGSLRLGWQMLRKKHPRLSFAEFSELAHKDLPNNLLEIDKCFVVLNIEEKSETEEVPSKEGEKS
jgi:hypothetical protein